MPNSFNRTTLQDNPTETNTNTSNDGLISVFGLFSVKPIFLLILAVIGYFVYSKIYR